MSGFYDELPFGRGKTLYGGTPTDTAYIHPCVGQEYRVRDVWFGTNRMITLRAVQNQSGAAVLAKRLARLSADGKALLGYTRLPEEKGFPIDHLLPSGGCASYDVCFVVVDGPAMCLTSLSNYGSDIAARDHLNSQTAVTSGATTAGRVDVRAVVAATTDATAGQRNVTEQDGVFARAISAALTNATNSDILVDVSTLGPRG